MQKLNRDIGSSFYTLHEEDEEYKVLIEGQVALNQHITFYYSGRNAFLAILKHIESNKDIGTIWLPNYYCDTVVNMLKQNYDHVEFYSVNPFGEFDKQVDFNAFAKSDDVVVLNNFWGLSSFNYDTETTNRPTIIEDHSHGWLSEQGLSSNADYCICSIRKSYPIPNGGIVWQPNEDKSFNFYEAINDNNIASAWKAFEDSMELKRAFIKEQNTSVKNNYLSLLNKGESLLNTSNNYTQPIKDHVFILNKFIQNSPIPIKEKHLAYLNERLEPSAHFKIIKREGFTPFGLLLLFKNEALFSSFKQYLISKNIYPAHLWPNNTVDLDWKHLFNIHTDFRYTMDDMDYIAETINHWTKISA